MPAGLLIPALRGLCECVKEDECSELRTPQRGDDDEYDEEREVHSSRLTPRTVVQISTLQYCMHRATQELASSSSIHKSKASASASAIAVNRNHP
jgi:hypothetical protein